MSEKQMFALLHELWRDFQQPDFLWQALSLCLSLGLGWWLSRRLRAHSKVHRTPSVARCRRSAPIA